MTREEIVENAKYIQFPYNNEVYRNYYEKVNPKRLPIIKDKTVLYTNMNDNGHHYTTEYTHNYVLPLLSELLDFNYNINDFNFIECVKPLWDISYIVPKIEYEYEIFNFTDNIHTEGKYIDLFNPEFFILNKYRELYRYPHSCSRIINKTLQNNRILMISGDSQIIPSINPLTSYFKEVWYFDNRTGYYKDMQSGEFAFHENEFRSFAKTYENVEFTDVLIECYCRNLNWYQYWNLQ